MSQLAVSDGQPGNWEEPDFLWRRFETERFQKNGWQEPYDGRLSRTVLWERGGEIPPRHPTLLNRRDFQCERYWHAGKGFQEIHFRGIISINLKSAIIMVFPGIALWLVNLMMGPE